MSVIHEALKRAERERASGLTPKEALPTTYPATLPRRNRRWIVAALGVPFLLVAGVFLTRQVNRPRTLPLPHDTVSVVPSPSAEPASLIPAAAPAVAAAADPDPARLNSQAVAAFREGKPEVARDLLEQALRLDPSLPEAHNNLGMVLQALGHRAEARNEFLRALALSPGYPEALNNLGLAWSGQGNQNEAIRSFEKALASKPGYSLAHLNLAIVYDKLGKKPDAFYHYRRFLEHAGPGEQELVRRVNDRLRR